MRRNGSAPRPPARTRSDAVSRHQASGSSSTNHVGDSRSPISAVIAAPANKAKHKSGAPPLRSHRRLRHRETFAIADPVERVTLATLESSGGLVTNALADALRKRGVSTPSPRATTMGGFTASLDPASSAPPAPAPDTPATRTPAPAATQPRTGVRRRQTDRVSGRSPRPAGARGQVREDRDRTAPHGIRTAPHGAVGASGPHCGGGGIRTAAARR